MASRNAWAGALGGGPGPAALEAAVGEAQQIRALERELGGAVLERLPQGVRLTAAGQSLLPEALATLRHAARARHAVRSALELEAAQLEIAVATSTARAVAAFARTEWTPLTSAFLDALRTYPWRERPARSMDLG